MMNRRVDKETDIQIYEQRKRRGSRQTDGDTSRLTGSQRDGGTRRHAEEQEKTKIQRDRQIR